MMLWLFLACTSDGQLFAFGNNKFYQLGLGDDAPRRDPTLVHFENIEEEHVVQVDCGDYHTAAVSGEIYATQCNTIHPFENYVVIIFWVCEPRCNVTIT